MGTPYRIEGIFNSSGYNGIVLLAYLFRVSPDAKLLTVNNISVNQITTTVSSTGFWSAILDGGAPLINLNMRNIYNAINNNTHFTNKFIGRISDPIAGGPYSWDSNYWYYVIYHCDPNLGTPLKSSFNTTKINTLPIVLGIDDNNMLDYPIIYDSAIFGLAKQSYCDGSTDLINRLTSPINLSV